VAQEWPDKLRNTGVTMSLYKDRGGEMHPTIGGISLMIVGFVLLFAGLFIGYTTISTTGVLGSQGTDSVTFTDNVKNAELVNLSYNGVIQRFEFNISCNAAECTATNVNAAVVNLTTTNNNIKAAANLTAAINANSTTSAYVTARNQSGYTYLTFNSVGTGSANVGLSENLANATVGSANFTAGTAAAPGAATTETYMATTFPIMGLALLVSGLFIVIGSVRGGLSGKGISKAR